MKHSSITGLLVLVACGCADHTNTGVPISGTEVGPEPNKQNVMVPATHPLARIWVATGITFNGIADPNFDPARRVELVMREDGTYTMSGSGNAVEGTWRQEGTSELHLTDKATGSLQRFGISTLDEQRLVVKLMDEMNAEVLLHYRAEQGPALAR